MFVSWLRELFTREQPQRAHARRIPVDEPGRTPGAVGRLRKEINSSLRVNDFNR